MKPLSKKMDRAFMSAKDTNKPLPGLGGESGGGEGGGAGGGEGGGDGGEGGGGGGGSGGVYVYMLSYTFQTSAEPRTATFPYVVTGRATTPARTPCALSTATPPSCKVSTHHSFPTVSGAITAVRFTSHDLVTFVCNHHDKVSSSEKLHCFLNGRLPVTNESGSCKPSGRPPHPCKNLQRRSK